MTTGDMFTYNSRLIVSFSSVAVLCAIIPYLIMLPLGLNYWVVFLLLILYGWFSGIAQNTVYTMAANLPFKYMGAVFFGNGLSAIACNILRAITLASFPTNSDDEAMNKQNSFLSAVVFMTIGALMLFMCVLLQITVIRKNPFFIYHLDWTAAKSGANAMQEIEEAQDYGLHRDTEQT